MADITEDKIRELAYQLWERDGSPAGKDDEYWHAAKDLLEDEGDADDENDGAPGVIPLVPPTVVGIK